MKRDKYNQYIEHPRYGRAPRTTGLIVDSLDSVVFEHWHYGRIANTAIAADTSKQLPATVQVTHYYDVDRTCRDCNRPFIFFAEEQKYWYEELEFPLEADAVHCVPCRRKTRELSKIKTRYEELCHANRLTSESYEMTEAAIVLVDEGIFGSKMLHTLKGILRQIPVDERDQSKGDALFKQIDSLEAFSKGKKVG